jgi:hypothetical protein
MQELRRQESKRTDDKENRLVRSKEFAEQEVETASRVSAG